MRRAGRVGLAVLSAFFGLGCDRTPEWPDAVSAWRAYENREVGYRVEVPAGCTADRYGSDVIFRWRGGPILAINWVTDEAGDRRGLWVDHEPTGETTLGGRAGNLYRYWHHDGPLGMQTLSYVVPHGGRWLGVELRMSSEAPGPVQRRVIESFAFAETR